MMASGDIAEAIADSAISGSKKALIRRERYCDPCALVQRNLREDRVPFYDDAWANRGCQGRNQGYLNVPDEIIASLADPFPFLPATAPNS